MYWIPAIFIALELIYLNYLDTMIRFYNTQYLYNKFKDEDLKKYIEKEFPMAEKITAFFGFMILFEFIYFIIGLFYPFWIISVFFIGLIVINNIILKFNKNQDKTERAIKFAKLKNFTSSNIKFDRMLKLNELKGTKEPIMAYVKMYFFLFLKIIIFISIIVLHYNYKLI